MNILLVEDDPVDRAFASIHLRRAGHDVQEADRAETAWELLQTGSFCLVLCDLNLPGFNGIELCRKLRRRPAREYVYCILITSGLGGGLFRDAMEAGADDFLPKPLDTEALAMRLRVAARILDFHRQVKTLEGLLPICMYCKKIRDDRSLWVHLESYVSARTGADFTHSLCPDCMEEKVQPQLDALRPPRPGS